MMKSKYKQQQGRRQEEGGGSRHKGKSRSSSKLATHLKELVQTELDKASSVSSSASNPQPPVIPPVMVEVLEVVEVPSPPPDSSTRAYSRENVVAGSNKSSNHYNDNTVLLAKVERAKAECYSRRSGSGSSNRHLEVIEEEDDIDLLLQKDTTEDEQEETNNMNNNPQQLLTASLLLDLDTTSRGNEPEVTSSLSSSRTSLYSYYSGSSRGFSSHHSGSGSSSSSSSSNIAEDGEEKGRLKDDKQNDLDNDGDDDDDDISSQVSFELCSDYSWSDYSTDYNMMEEVTESGREEGRRDSNKELDSDNSNEEYGAESEFQDSIDAIREEASKMDTIMAMDQLDTMRHELKSLRRSLSNTKSQLSEQRTLCKLKDDRLATLELERDLYKAESSVVNVAAVGNSTKNNDEEEEEDGGDDDDGDEDAITATPSAYSPTVDVGNINNLADNNDDRSGKKNDTIEAVVTAYHADDEQEEEEGHYNSEQEEKEDRMDDSPSPVRVPSLFDTMTPSPPPQQHQQQPTTTSHNYRRHYQYNRQYQHQYHHHRQRPGEETSDSKTAEEDDEQIFLAPRRMWTTVTATDTANNNSSKQRQNYNEYHRVSSSSRAEKEERQQRHQNQQRPAIESTQYLLGASSFGSGSTTGSNNFNDTAPFLNSHQHQLSAPRSPKKELASFIIHQSRNSKVREKGLDNTTANVGGGYGSNTNRKSPSRLDKMASYSRLSLRRIMCNSGNSPAKQHQLQSSSRASNATSETRSNTNNASLSPSAGGDVEMSTIAAAATTCTTAAAVSLQDQVEELQHRLITSMETCEELKRRLATVTRYYNSVVTNLNTKLCQTATQQSQMEIDYIHAINSREVSKQRTLQALEMRLRQKEEEIERLRKTNHNASRY